MTVRLLATILIPVTIIASMAEARAQTKARSWASGISKQLSKFVMGGDQRFTGRASMTPASDRMDSVFSEV